MNQINLFSLSITKIKTYLIILSNLKPTFYERYEFFSLDSIGGQYKHEDIKLIAVKFKHLQEINYNFLNSKLLNLYIIAT